MSAKKKSEMVVWGTNYQRLYGVVGGWELRLWLGNLRHP